jgi:LmbE family N-acetylglucosaminyl deacetylase
LNALSFTPRSRLLLLVPHPDDESLGCGVLLQRATRAGAKIRVVYVTEGENNPWPQRALERKWRLTDVDRSRWGRLRRKEALAALAVLGVCRSDVSFLRLPDQGLTSLLLSGYGQLLDLLGRIIAEWRPTDILAPDISDTHPDHSAVGLTLRLILQDLASADRPASSWSFLVHGQREDFIQRAISIRQSREETAIKLAAICCHTTQLKLSCARFMAYASRPEYFLHRLESLVAVV